MRAAILTVVLSLMLAGTTLGQGWTGPAGVGIEVRDEAGQPIQGAAVVLAQGSAASGDAPPFVFTDAGGRIEVRNLAEGEWQIEVRAAGYMIFNGYLKLAAGKPPDVGFSSRQRTGTFWQPLQVRFFVPGNPGEAVAVAQTKEERKEEKKRIAEKGELETQEKKGKDRSEIREERRAKASSGEVAVLKKEPTPPPPPPPAVAQAPPPAPAAAPPSTVAQAAPPAPAVAPPPAAAPPPPPVAQAPPPPPSAPVTQAPPPRVAETSPPPAQPSSPASPPPPVRAPAAPAAPPAPVPPVPPSSAAPPAPPPRAAPPPSPPPSPSLPQPNVPPPPPSPSLPQPNAPPAAPSQPSAPSTAPAAPPPEPRVADVARPSTPSTAEPAPSRSAAAPAAPAPAAPAPAAPAASSSAPSHPPSIQTHPVLFTGGACPECKPGEWALIIERRAAPSASGAAATSSCGQGRDAAVHRLAQEVLVPSVAAAAFAGPVADGYGNGLPVEVSQAAPADLSATLGARDGSCQDFVGVLPQGARFIGFRFEAEDGSGRGDCFGEDACSIGQARWSNNPKIERTTTVTVIHSSFSNESTSVERRARMTLYFQPPRGWRPPG